MASGFLELKKEAREKKRLPPATYQASWHVKFIEQAVKERMTCWADRILLFERGRSR